MINNKKKSKRNNLLCKECNKYTVRPIAIPKGHKQIQLCEECQQYMIKSFCELAIKKKKEFNLMSEDQKNELF
jgi:hypothetical protein